MLNAMQGRPVSPFGFSSTLRNFGRFGLLFKLSSHQHGSLVISKEHLEKIQIQGRPELFVAAEAECMFGGETVAHNTYQWDHVMADGDFYKDGAFGWSRTVCFSVSRIGRSLLQHMSLS